VVNDMTTKQDRIAQIEERGMLAKGKKELVAHMEGRPQSKGQALLAKCYDCMGYYSDGKTDCCIISCPLYPYMPYKEGGARRTRTLTDEQREAVATRLRAGRGK